MGVRASATILRPLRRTFTRSAEAEKAARPSAINRTRGAILCANLTVAAGLLDRAIGLIGRDRLEPSQGLLIDAGPFDPFMWLHTMLMSFPIDIVFLDQTGRVLTIDHELRPWRLSSIAVGARCALELPAGTARRTATQTGDIVTLERT